MEEESKNEEILCEAKTRKVKVWDFRRGNGFTRTETEAFRRAGKEIVLMFAKALSAYTKEAAECGEPARIVKDGKVIALAEVLAIDDNFGIRITSTADADCESFLLNFYSSLTDKEKDTVIGICKEMVFLAKKSRREGILCLEEGADEIQLKFPDKNGRFMYLLLHCLTEGWPPSSLSRIADNYTRSSCADGFERLCFSIIEEGILSIQAGDSPRIMQERFVSLFGIENEKDFREKTGFNEKWI